MSNINISPAYAQKASIALSGKELKVTGNLVFPTVSEILKKSHKLLQNTTAESIEIDLGGIQHIDSAGVALLVEWQGFCQEHNISCQFKGLNKQTVSLIETYKLMESLNISNSQHE